MNRFDGGWIWNENLERERGGGRYPMNVWRGDIILRRWLVEEEEEGCLGWRETLRRHKRLEDAYTLGLRWERK